MSPPRNTKAKMSTSTQEFGGVPLGAWRSGFFFLLGLVIGNTGILQSKSSSEYSSASLSLRSPTDTITTLTNNQNKPEATIPALEEKHEVKAASVVEKSSSLQKNDHDNGWQQVNVFYGQRLSMIPKEDSKTPKSFSQVGQDFKIVNMLGGPTSSSSEGGYFIDLAANHATALSNSYHLEQQRNWKGLCMEANPIYWFDLARYRSCDIVGAVIGNDHRTNESMPFAFPKRNNPGKGARDGAVMGGLVGYDQKEGGKGIDVVDVYTVPIAEILERFDVPKLIDYMSLDVEGAEFFVMKNFPFHDYTIKIVTIERPTGDLINLLSKNGYEKVKDLSTWGETLWIHSDFKDQLDLSQA